MFGSVDSDVDRWIIIPAGHVRNLFDMEEYLHRHTQTLDINHSSAWWADIVQAAALAEIHTDNMRHRCYI